MTSVTPYTPMQTAGRYVPVNRLNTYYTHVHYHTAAPTLINANELFTVLAIAALVELGIAYYTAAPHMSDSLRDAIQAAMEAGQLKYCRDMIGQIATAPGRGVQLAYGNGRYEWSI